MNKNWLEYRKKIIGLGENSFKKSYYPELQSKIDELNTSKLNLETIFNSTSDAIIVNDRKGDIITMNKQALILYNINPEEIVKYNISDISSKKNEYKDFESIWNEVMEKGFLTFEWIALQQETGNEINVQISLNRSFWDGMQVLVAVVRDFTERKKYEKRLLNALEKAKESDRLKTAFLQNMSHEIRTPLNAISGFSELLNTPNLSDEKQKQFTSIIQNSSKQLASIVSDILTISSLETNQEQVNTSNVCINTVILELLEIFKPQANRQGVSLYTKLELNNHNAEIQVDKTKLTQIISNLLSNAFKYTSQGYIEFGYTLDGDFLNFFVKDTGIGILPEFQELIFDRFAQAPHHADNLHSGTGLGLPISQAFVQLLGGKIWVESSPTHGSTFHFTIPYIPVIGMHPAKPHTTDTTKQQAILIAEDEEYNYLYLEHLLKEVDAKKLHAKNGAEALEIYKKNPNISLIVMDIKMPKMNGFEVAKIIKSANPNLPIIAQSAYALEHEVEKYKEIFNEYLTKPMNGELFLNTVLKYL